MAEVVELLLLHHHHHHHHLLHRHHDSSEEEVESQILQDSEYEDDDDPVYWSSSLEIHDHDRGVEETPPNFLETAGSVGARVLDCVQEIGSDFLGLGSFRLDRDDDISLEEEDDGGGDGFCLGCGDEGLRIVGFESDSEDDDVGIPLQWDCLRIEDARRDEDFEWEEVDDRLVDDSREVVDRIGELVDADEEEEEVEVARNVEWEVLLTMNNIERNSSSSVEHTDFESFFGEEHDQDQDDYVYTSEYEVLFEQFAEHDGFSGKGSPPAAKSVIEKLPSVVLSQDDVDKSNTLCAVCKDDIAVGESVKQLPCLHHYHEDCILPWLGMRNTCPVCRHELPSDDPDYENSRTRRANAAGRGDESRARYMFEVFPAE